MAIMAAFTQQPLHFVTLSLFNPLGVFMSGQRLLAEWEPQDAVLLTWPHKNTNWDYILDDVIQLYEALVTVICDYADLVIAAPTDELDEIRARLQQMNVPLEYVYLYPVASNDTWARDHGPLTVMTDSGLKLLDFEFNGWGNKHPFELDNQITQKLFAQNAFAGVDLEAQDWVLEGGSIETDGRGTLMTTAQCLLNPNRNPNLSKADIEQRLSNAFGVRKINWLQHGY